MFAQQIRQMIADAVREDARTGRLASVLVQMARGNGKMLGTEDVSGSVEFIRSYVEGVPGWLEALDDEASRVGMAENVAPVLQAALQYFVEGCDLIPDHLGLIGLVDDAYLALRIVEIVNDQAEEQVGRRLVDVDLAGVNALIRSLIGEPMATELDEVVSKAARKIPLDLPIDASSLPLHPTPHPIIGNRFAEQEVRAEMGRYGIV